jgi:hypothetical protein
MEHMRVEAGEAIIIALTGEVEMVEADMGVEMEGEEVVMEVEEAVETAEEEGEVVKH